MILYSASARGFFDSALHSTIPADAVVVAADEHRRLLAGQASGQVIVPDTDGSPVLADPPGPTDAQLAAQYRVRRDALLAASDWTQLPDAPLSEEARLVWATYRQALRDVPQQDGFPRTVSMPTPPTSAEEDA